MPPSRSPLPALPIDEVLPALVASLSAHPNAVLRAPTGAGKTTRVPPALLAAGLARGGQTVMTEPRRVAARAAARRIAFEQGWTLGREVGYQVRFERAASPETAILVVSEGILVERLEADPFLDGISILLFDEIHERTLQADLALAMARKVQREVRPDLAIVAMSATVDPGPLAEFLGGAPVVESAGRLHPVEIRHLGGPDLRLDPREIPRRVADAVVGALAESDGGVLAFLPGRGEIERTAERLESIAAAADAEILPLFGELPPERQDAAIAPSLRRKIVLATNVAETSVTVAGVSTVVDSGLARSLRFDAATGLDRLELARISRAAAEQRAGRAGRERAGLCLRLWPALEHAALPEREKPEIARVDLAAAALGLLAWGERDLAAFGWFEPPERGALERALALLERLGARDAAGRLTARGRAMAELPVQPRLARLLLEGVKRGVGAEAALAAALLAERDPFRRGAGAGSAVPSERRGRRAASHASRSDLLDRIDALEAFERSGGRRTESAAGELAPAAARQVLAVRDQLRRLLGRGARPGADAAAPADRDRALLAAIAAAYPDRIARRREAGSPRAVMVGGGGVRLGEESAVLADELFACVVLDASSAAGEPRVRVASGIDAADLPREPIVDETRVAWDEARERAVAHRVTRFDDLVLAEREVAPAADEASRLLAAAAVKDLSRALPLAEPAVASFLARCRFLAHWCPELGLPRLDAPALHEIVADLCVGCRSFAELNRAPLLDHLRARFTFAQLAALDREAPERLAVPSGSLVRLDYPADPADPPVLAVRIQELFGLGETPRIAAGRVPVLLHLLAPNHRPQQVTRDLESFWRTIYPEVRKELAGRYPKHSWPLDPRRAEPERRPRRRPS